MPPAIALGKGSGRAGDEADGKRRQRGPPANQIGVLFALVVVQGQLLARHRSCVIKHIRGSPFVIIAEK